jgi:hypothetical protein
LAAAISGHVFRACIQELTLIPNQVPAFKLPAFTKRDTKAASLLIRAGISDDIILPALLRMGRKIEFIRFFI